MRSISLIILLAAIFTLAADAPPLPPPPLVMNIIMTDGTVESVPCSRVDQEAGITFVNNGMKMIVNLSDPDPIYPEFNPPIKSVKYFVTSQIACITFDVIAPPAEQ